MNIEICFVCQLYEVSQNNLGRGGARTCGVGCSQIRNSVSSDEAAREKWLKINEGRRAYRRFVLGFAVESA